MLQKIIVSNCASENFFELLDKNSICYIKSLNNEKFNNNYNDHIDLSILRIDNDIYIENSVFEYYKDFLKDYNLIKVDVSDFKNGETVLNVAKNDKYFFHNEKFTSKEIFESLNLKRDEGVFKSLKSKNINVELVTTDGIILNGYKNGFIGGTCGFVSDDTLLFYGDVTKYQDYDIIKRVADEENVKILFPKGEDFVDLGGIVSLWR